MRVRRWPRFLSAAEVKGIYFRGTRNSVAFVNIPPLSAPNVGTANCCAVCTAIGSRGAMVGE
jgi:hypothetical protein